MHDFLARVLPRQGYLVALVFPAQGGRPRHIVKSSVSALSAVCEREDAKGNTVYFACASYTSRKYYDAGEQKWRVRTAENVSHVRSQWLDIDVSAEKASSGEGYASRQDAVAALIEVCKTLKLPAPMVVSSGYGIHAYWPFTRDVPRHDATVWMETLSAALSDAGLRHDTTRTADIASILRPVGSHNYKDPQRPRPVKLLRDIPADIDPERLYQGLDAVTAGDRLPELTGLQEDGWESGVQHYAPSSAKRIASQCRALHHAAKRKGDIPEPYWRAMLGLLKHTEEGEVLIHTWSEGHPEYSRDETEEKAQRWKKGPTSCEHFNDVSRQCQQCPHWGKITSPITLGEEPPEKPARADTPQEPTQVPLTDLKIYSGIDDVDSLPFWHDNYAWDGTHLYMLVDNGKKAAWQPISNTLYYPFLRYETEDRTRAAKVCALTDVRKQRWREFDIETEKVADSRALALALGQHEVLYMPGSRDRNRQFMEDMLYGLRDSGLETTTYNSFGWHDDGCVIGNQMITSGTGRQIYLGSRVPEDLRNGMMPRGDALAWTRAIDEVYNRAGAEAFQFIICAGFAAPIVYLCESDMWHGIPIALVGQSGVGKTATSKVACGIFGDPRTFSIQANEEGTTLKALLQRVSIMRHLPILLDEITGREAGEMQALLFALSNGKPKQRLRPNGEFVEGGQHWDTISFVTSNQSIIETLAQSDILRADATQVRVFEIEIDDSYISKVFKGVNAKEIIERELLSRNCGAIGHSYLRFLAKNREKITRQLQKQRSLYASGIDQQGRERFYYDLIAVVLQAARYAKKLGYIQFDLERMEQWALQHVQSLRHKRKTSLDTPEDYLQAFLSTLTQHTIVTNFFRDGRQKIEGERVVEPLREPQARNATDDRRFYVTLKAYQDWCMLRRIDAAWLLKQLMKEGYVMGEPMRQRITKGTKISGTQARCIELNYDKLDGEAIQIPDQISVIEGSKADAKSK